MGYRKLRTCHVATKASIIIPKTLLQFLWRLLFVLLSLLLKGCSRFLTFCPVFRRRQQQATVQIWREVVTVGSNTSGAIVLHSQSS